MVENNQNFNARLQQYDRSVLAYQRAKESFIAKQSGEDNPIIPLSTLVEHLPVTANLMVDVDVIHAIGKGLEYWNRELVSEERDRILARFSRRTTLE